jgi:hypothetical protein
MWNDNVYMCDLIHVISTCLTVKAGP